MTVRDLNRKFEIVMLTTGGTIEKTYCEFNGDLKNREAVLKKNIFSKLRLPHTKIEVVSLFSKDSLDMVDEDRQKIYEALEKLQEKKRAIIVVHGTDTMEKTASYCYDRLKDVEYPIIFTGAMKPLGFLDTDAHQNLTEALLAAKICNPGIYISFHSRMYLVPRVRKNRHRGTFESY